MAKKELTIKEFRAIVKEEAIKLKKRIVLENEKKELQKELKNIISESYVEDGMDEVSLGKVGRAINLGGSYRPLIIKTAKENSINLAPDAVEKLVAQMKADGGSGKLVPANGTLIYKPFGRVAPHGAGAPGGSFSSNE